MKFCTTNGKELDVTVAGANATLPLIRGDSEIGHFTKDLYAIYTPSTGIPAALLLGSFEACIEACKEWKP